MQFLKEKKGISKKEGSTQKRREYVKNMVKSHKKRKKKEVYIMKEGSINRKNKVFL